METEQARHETEETLRLAQFATSQKLQNGCQSFEGNSLHIGEDTNWNHYTPSTVTNFMKRHQENCSSPTPLPGLSEPASHQINSEIVNGEMKHVLPDQSFLVHQSKKLKMDPSSLSDGFSDLAKATEFQCNVSQTQIDVERRNCTLSNGDVYGIPRNKQIISNGVSPPSTIESTPGDLLEKTLSHYFPEHVSIAPQATKTPINAINGSDANKLTEGAQKNVLTSGLPALSQMPAGYVMNGYSNSCGDDQHQQQQRQHQPSSYPDSQGQLPVMAFPINAANATLQHPNGPEIYHEKTNSQGVNQNLNHNSFSNHNIQEYGVQPQRYQQNSGNSTTNGMTLQPPSHTGLDNEIKNLSPEATMSNSQSNSWTEPKSLQQPFMNNPSPNLQENSMWRRTTSPQTQKMVQRVQAQGAFNESSQGLHAHQNTVQQNNATKWQHSQCKTLPDQSFHLHNEATESSYRGNMQTEHSREQQHSHPQRPLSQPPQYDGQQLKSPIYRPHSQPQPGHQLVHSQRNVNHAGELQQHLHSPALSRTNLKAFQQQHCQPTDKVEFSPPSAQNHSLLPQQAQPKSELQHRTSCSQQPLTSGDIQRHAALRMHLLQKQERHASPHPRQSPSDMKHGIKIIKEEQVERFDFPGPSHQQMHMREIRVKQEPQEFLCDQNKKQSSILASMEQSLKQYQLSPVFEKKSIVINSHKVKVESSGPVTILSAKTDLNGEEISMSSSTALKKPADSSPKKEHLLQSFMESPLKLLDTPIKNLLDTPLKTQYDIASCHCVEQISEKDEGPYYTHLGSAPSVQGIRELMEKRSGLTGRAIRIEKVIYTGKEGKSTQGCPIAKWVIRRSSAEEKLLMLVRERNGHTCESACIIVAMLVWEGIPQSLADRLYSELSQTLTKYGAHTQRRCALNEERTCACQGYDPEFSGASFSFGCSWSMYYNGCKFARSKIPRKFKLIGDDVREEERLETNFQNLATLLAPLYKTMAPEAYGNQVEHEHRATDCRLGLKEGRPFSGVTACMDFCAHAHRDLHNMQGGSTVVCTLTREDNREIGKIPEDEQLHVLPLYKPSSTDEFGSEEGQREKVKSGAIQVLSAFRRQVRMLAEPAKSCRQKKLEAKKAAAHKNAMLESEKTDKALQIKTKNENSETTPSKIGPVSGVMGSRMDTGQPQNHFGTIPNQHHHHQQQQHPQAIPPPYPGTTNSVNFQRYPNHPGSFPSTSKPGNTYPPQSPTQTSSYPSPHHLQSSYMNGSGHPYPGYQRNGSMPVNYHPFYGSNTRLEMYQQQRPSPLEQQYGVPQRYNYPPRYGEPGLQVNGYNTCGMGSVHPMRSPFPHYGPTGTTNAQYIDPHSRSPSVHGGLSNQFCGYPNPYLTNGPQILPPGQDPLQSQVKTEIASPVQQMLPGQISAESQIPTTSSLQNGNAMGLVLKQEPVTPTTPQKPEVWSDNEHNFLDPDIGGVAVAPSHGSVLIECAKRELHATTPLKKPDRNHPTRISLVFYQHKNLNEAKHGLAQWEAKMAEKAREKEEEAERNGGEGTPTKSGKKGVKREHSEVTEPGEPPYKRFIQSLLEGSLSNTTNTYVSTSPYAFTKVTGPYRQFV